MRGHRPRPARHAVTTGRIARKDVGNDDGDNGEEQRPAPRRQSQWPGGGQLRCVRPPPLSAHLAIATGTTTREDVGVGDGNNNEDKDRDEDSDGNKDEVATKTTTRGQQRRLRRLRQQQSGHQRQKMWVDHYLILKSLNKCMITRI